MLKITYTYTYVHKLLFKLEVGAIYIQGQMWHFHRAHRQQANSISCDSRIRINYNSEKQNYKWLTKTRWYKVLKNIKFMFS